LFIDRAAKITLFGSRSNFAVKITGHSLKIGFVKQ